MPDYGVEVPVWHGPDSDDLGLLDGDHLLALGVSGPLIERLRAWQEAWDHDPSSGSPPRDTWPDQPSVQRLARDLQAELPGHRIFLFTGTGGRPRPVEE
jgi:hypothetical protein